MSIAAGLQVVHNSTDKIQIFLVRLMQEPESLEHEVYSFSECGVVPLLRRRKGTPSGNCVGEYDTFLRDFSASGSCGRGLSLWWSATTSSCTVMIEFIDIKIVIAQPGARALPAQLGPLL